MIRSVVEVLDRAQIFELLMQTIEVQKQGGHSKQTGGKKSAGGVFLTFVKKKATKDQFKQIQAGERSKQKDKKQMIMLTKVMQLSCRNPEFDDTMEESPVKSHKTEKIDSKEKVSKNDTSTN